MRKRLYILIPIFIAIPLALLAVDYFVLTSHAQIERQVRKFFREELKSEVEFSEISQPFFSTRITIHDIKLYPVNDKSRQYLSAEKLEIRLDLLAAFNNAPIKKIKFIKPHIRLERDRRRNWNFPLSISDKGPFRGLVENTPTPEIEMDDATIEIRDARRSASNVLFDGLNFTLKGNGGDKGHALTVAYYYGEERKNRHLQLTFSMPANGDGMTITTSGSGSNYLYLNEDIRKLLRHLDKAGIHFARKARRVWHKYKISGAIRVDSLVIQEYPDAPPENQWQVDADLFLDNCSLTVPYNEKDENILIEYIYGRVQVKEGTVELDINARALGNAIESIKGTIAVSQQSDETSQIEITVPYPQFDKRIRRLFPPENDVLLDGLEINSGVSLVLKVMIDPDTGKTIVDPGLRFDNGSMFLKIFPYHMEKMCGELWIKDGKIEIPESGLKLVHGEGEITVSGTAEIDNLENPQLDLILTGKNVPLDDEFYAILPETTQVVLDCYIDKRKVKTASGAGSAKWLAGYADLHCVLKTDPDGIIVPDITLDISQGTARLEDFPYPLEDITGKILIDGPDACNVRLRDLTARQETGVFTIADGLITLDTVDVEVIAKSVPVDEKLGAALEGSYRKSYNLLNLKGTVDVTVRVTQASGQAEPDVTATIESRGTLSFAHSDFPLPVTAISTRFVVSSNELVIEKFSGMVGGATVAASDKNCGSITFGDTSEIHFHIAAIEGLQLTKKNIDAMPEDTGKPMLALNLGGTVDIKDLDIKYFIEGEKEDCKSYEISMLAHCRDVSIGKNIKKINGAVRMKIGKERDEEHIRITGNSPNQDFTFKVFGLTVKDLNMEICPPETEEEKTINRHRIAFAGTFYGSDNKSSFIGWFNMPLGNNTEYKGNIKIFGADLNAILIDLEKERNKDKPDAKPTPAKDLPTGLIRLDLSFNYQDGDISTLKGEGWLRFTKANLGTLSLIARLKAYIKGALSEDGIINRGRIDFHIDNPHITFDKILLKSDSLTIVGNGTADFDGNLDIDIFSETIMQLPVVRPFFNLFGKSIYAARITGTLSEPVFGASSFIDRISDIPKNMLEMIKDMPNLRVGDEEE